MNRWKKLAQEYKTEIHNLLEIIPDVFGKYAPEVLKIIEEKFSVLLDRLPAEFADEISGIAEAAEIEMGEAVLYNIFYELFTLCTSIVAQDEQGQVFHGRNLDFGIFPDYNFTDDQWGMTTLLRPLLVDVTFTREDRPLYRSVHFIGYVGILTAMKPGYFSVTVDDRFDDDFDSGLINWMHDPSDPAQFFGMFLRDLFQKPEIDYYQSLSLMNSTELISPIYFITSGAQPTQGAVITREKDLSLNVWTLSEQLNSGSFYVVETNYDHWKPEPWFDQRRKYAKKCLNETGSTKIDFGTLFNVLDTKPVRNQLTTYTVLMNVATGDYEVYYQYCESPCAPW